MSGETEESEGGKEGGKGGRVLGCRQGGRQDHYSRWKRSAGGRERERPRQIHHVTPLHFTPRYVNNHYMNKNIKKKHINKPIYRLINKIQ